MRFGRFPSRANTYSGSDRRQKAPYTDSALTVQGLMNTNLQSGYGLFVANDLIQLHWTILLDPAVDMDRKQCTNM